MSDIKVISCDLETFSSADLAQCGVYKYVEAPDFEILLFGYSVNGGSVKVIDLASGERLPDEIINALTNPGVIKWAFNAQFERICLSRWIGLPTGQYLDPRSWHCAMVWSAYMGLPLSLEGAGAVLGLEKQKLIEGKDLIRYFCKPCSPTTTNQGRTRNLPNHAPDKWAAFKTYNQRDVETELAIQDKLARFPVPDSLWAEYHLDQEINDRGVALDRDLVTQAIEADRRSRSELTMLMQELTELENPNSVAQMKHWLCENGLETDTLGKKAVSDLLKTAPDALRQVLSLRLQLAKSSVKKYHVMENVVCADGRARGMFQFYGANRTGRFSGRLIQLQNLPQNHMPDLAQARDLLHSGNYEALDLLYDSVPEVLSELIRTAFVPRPGRRFIVADFSAIEARVIAWLAGESWRQAVFAAGGDIYCASASQMFRVPVEKHGVNGHLRQKGKQAELACIAEGQLVLTDSGLVPIEKITSEHKLWDGENWVSHGGLIDKGIGKVITYEGLTATPDHLVWVERQSQPIQLGDASACSAHLIQTGTGRQAIRLGKNYQPGEAMEPELEPLLCLYPMYRLWKNAMAAFKQLAAWQVKRVSALFTAASNSFMARQKINRRQTTLRKPERSRLSQLWRERYPILFSKCYRGWSVSDKRIWLTKKGSGNRSYRQQQGLHLWESSFRNTCREQFQQAMHSSFMFLSRVLALFASRCHKKALSWTVEGRDHQGCGDRCLRKAEELANNQRTARLYDIRDAGRNHRFTVSGKLVHNCGYGGSVGALKAMGALEMGLAEDELQPLVSAWRSANPNIVRLWWDVDRAVLSAVKNRTTEISHGIRVSCQSGMLSITLPSGRRLTYIKPRIGLNQFGSDCVTYEGIGATKKWERLESYGPKFVENIVQAISRDILCYALQTLRDLPIVMHVHDEIVIEADQQISVEHICQQMGQTPPWADGLLLRADGYETDFYRKS